MNIIRFPLFSLDQLSDIIVTLVAIGNAIFFHSVTVVFPMTKTAGNFPVWNKVPEKESIVVMEIFLILNFFLFFSTNQQGMACLTEFLLVIDNVGTILTSMLVMAEEAVSVKCSVMFESLFYKRSIVAF